jgi:phosphatidylglycerophosphatase A
VNLFKLFLVTAGFLGCSPWAPGTVGTLGGVLIAWALSGSSDYLLWTTVACVAIYAVGRSLGPWSERHAGRKDPGIFVLDEVLGYLITVAWTSGPSLLALVVAFFVFRFFDIFKPRLARRLERVPGGDGILLDDLVAGLYGFALVMLPARLWIDVPWTTGG